MYFEWTKDASNVVSVHISESEDEEEEEEAEGMAVYLSSLLVFHEYVPEKSNDFFNYCQIYMCLSGNAHPDSFNHRLLFSTLPSATDGSI